MILGILASGDKCSLPWQDAPVFFCNHWPHSVGKPVQSGLTNGRGLPGVFCSSNFIQKRHVVSVSMNQAASENSLHASVSLAMELIRCPSIAPEDGGAQSILKNRLERACFGVEQIERAGVQSLYAESGNQGPLMLFAVHSDVVPPGDVCDWTSLPFQPEIRHGLLFGRGAADMKGPLSCAVVAAEKFVQEHPDMPMRIGFIVAGDEEPANNHGTTDVLQWLHSQGKKVDYCVVTEPTSAERFGDTIKVGRRGSINGHLTIHGLQGHAAYPQHAVNPVHRSLWVLHTLAERNWDEGDAHFPPAGFQITNVSAGTGANNVIPGRFNVSFNIRHGPSLTVEKVESLVKDAMGMAGLSYELAAKSDAIPFLTEEGPFTELCSKAIEEVSGLRPDPATGGGTSDARFIAPHCPHLVEFGLVGKTSHQVDEHVAVTEMEQLSEVYGRMLRKLAGYVEGQ